MMPNDVAQRFQATIAKEISFSSYLPQNRIHVPVLLRHLSRYLVRPHRMLIRLLPVPEVVAQIHQRQRDAEPHQQQRDHRGERHRAAARLAPNKEIQEEASAGDDGRIKGGGQEGRPFPLTTLHRLVETRRKVARHQTHEHVEEYRGGGERAPRSGREHSHHGEN